MRLLAFDLGVTGASGFGLLGMQLLAEAGLLGSASGLGEQLGVAGLIGLVVAVMLVRREVNRVLVAVEQIHGLELRITQLEGQMQTLLPAPPSTGRHRRRAEDRPED
jgi:hypothetical protein